MENLILNSKVKVVDTVALVEYVNGRIIELLETKVLIHGTQIDVINNYRKGEVNRCLDAMKKKEIQYVLGVANEMVALIRVFDNLEINPNLYNFVRHIQDTYGETKKVSVYQDGMSFQDVVTLLNSRDTVEITFEKANGTISQRPISQNNETKKFNKEEIDNGDMRYLYFIDDNTNDVRKCIFNKLIDIN